jgi:hypothetical protein
MTEIPVRSRCSNLCGMHCTGHVALAEVSLRDAGALMQWLAEGARGTFTPASASRLTFEGRESSLLVTVKAREGERR